MPLRESEAKVVLALLQKEEVPIMALPKVAGLGSSAVYNSIRWLSERGLVQESREKKAPRRRMIMLTEKGKKLARIVGELEAEL